MLTMEHQTQAVLASDKLSLCLMANPDSDCVAMLHRTMVLECIGQTMVVSNAFPRLQACAVATLNKRQMTHRIIQSYYSSR
jgi:hypothetical protein